MGQSRAPAPDLRGLPFLSPPCQPRECYPGLTRRETKIRTSRRLASHEASRRHESDTHSPTRTSKEQET